MPTFETGSVGANMSPLPRARPSSLCTAPCDAARDKEEATTLAKCYLQYSLLPAKRERRNWVERGFLTERPQANLGIFMSISVKALHKGSENM